MDLSNLTYPERYAEPSEGQVDRWEGRFEDHVWYNSELCNNCFQRIRVVGDVVEYHTDLFVHELTTDYDRTENGSQEFDPFLLASDRYGQCYCLDCGADTKAERDDLSLSKMTDRGVNLVRYIDHQTDYPIKGTVMTRSIIDLKGIHDNGGYDTEIFCVALNRAIEAGRRAVGDKRQVAHAD